MRMRQIDARLALLPLLVLAGLAAGCGGNPATVSATRPGSIPTATMPANLPDPILLAEAQTAGRPATGGTGGSDTYTLKSGDTLYKVAETLGIPEAQRPAWVADVIKLNGIQDTTRLSAGQELTIPRVQPTPAATGTPATGTRTPAAGATGTAATSTAVPAATQRPTSAPSGRTYTVQSGDYPLLIAQKLGVPEAQQSAWAAELLSLNGIAASGLQVGMILQLPASTPAGGGAAPAATATPTR